MKYLLTIFALAAFATGCRNVRQSEIVKETFIHKYGVPVAKTDWEAQGKDGKVVQLRKDGVTVTQSVRNDIPHGETTYTFAHNDTIQFVETYQNGTLVSKRENYTSGVPYKEETFAQGQLVKLTHWYEDGTPFSIENFDRGCLITGEYRSPLNVVDSRIIEGSGVKLCRTNDGMLLAKETFQNGRLFEKTTFYPNGDPASVASYSNDVIHGIRLTFLQGGIPQTMEQWQNGVQEGVTIFYQNGEKASEIPFVNGKRNGLEQRFRDGMYLVEEITWKEDVQHGPRRLYVDGETTVEWYHEGSLVSRPTFERMNLPSR